MEQFGRKLIRGHMPAEHQEFFAQLPLLVVGTVDATGRPRASVLAGRPGFFHAVDSRTLRVTARPIYGDPLSKALVDGADIGGLGLEFQTRRRNRVNGRVARTSEEGFDIQVVQSFGNCPKYIQARELDLQVTPDAVRAKRPVHGGQALSKAEAAMIARSDTFFIASRSRRRRPGSQSTTSTSGAERASPNRPKLMKPSTTVPPVPPPSAAAPSRGKIKGAAQAQDVEAEQQAEPNRLAPLLFKLWAYPPYCGQGAVRLIREVAISGCDG